MLLMKSKVLQVVCSALRLDESTDVANPTYLHVDTLHVHNDDINTEFLFRKPLEIKRIVKTFSKTYQTY
jgi:hypothetical protein